jgi:hypothetical protein
LTEVKEVNVGGDEGKDYSGEKEKQDVNTFEVLTGL